MSKVSYTKPYLSIQGQVELIRARGMEITDDLRAQACFQRVGYYRLSGYWFPFRHQDLLLGSDGKEERRTSETFRPQTSFSTVMDLYVFDKRLRLLFINAIERIEVGLRVDLALLLGARGAFTHRDPTTFNTFFQQVDPIEGKSAHDRFPKKLDESLLKSREDFALRFKEKYGSAIPIWMSIELWDFGTLASAVSGLRDGDLKVLAERYGLPRNKLVVSWTQSINFVRNVCAHHGRLWNRPPIQQPGPTRIGEVPLLDHLATDAYAQRRLYAVAASLQFLLRTIHPDSTWAERLRSHLTTLPAAQEISIRQMGFPVGWDTLPLWQTQ